MPWKRTSALQLAFKQQQTVENVDRVSSLQKKGLEMRLVVFARPLLEEAARRLTTRQKQQQVVCAG